MTTPERRADAESRLRKAHATLGAAKALLGLDPPCRDDAVNRAAVAALQAARALIDSKWAPDFTQYLRTLVEDGLEADAGEGPEYDDEEARVAIGTSEKLVMTVAGQLGLADDLRADGAAAAARAGAQTAVIPFRSP